MSDEFPRRDDATSTGGWSDDVATLEVTGADRREALEAGLRAVLAIAGEGDLPSGARQEFRAAPIRGEGPGLDALFADLVEDLLEQVADYGPLVHDVSLDGVLRKDQGGFVGWGYVAVPARANTASARLRLHGSPRVREADTGGFVVRASLARA